MECRVVPLDMNQDYNFHPAVGVAQPEVSINTELVETLGETGLRNENRVVIVVWSSCLWFEPIIWLFRYLAVVLSCRPDPRRINSSWFQYAFMIMHYVLYRIFFWDKVVSPRPHRRIV